MKKLLNNKLLSGALILSLGGLLTKALGAFYRIPLTNLLGAEGIGIYQAVFPLYSLLLTASSTGVPNGIAKMISGGDVSDGYSVLKSALTVFLPLGLIGSLVLLLLCKPISNLQGNGSAYIAYALISPSVILVSVISCFRGFFQGNLNMKPTAISQIIEQLVKLIFGLSLCSLIDGKVELKAGLATLSVTISEFIACAYFFILFKIKRYCFKGFKGVKTNCLLVIKTVFPIMLSTIVIPVARTVESFFVLNLINRYSENATSLYGLYSGAVESIVSVPVAVCYAIAVTAVPIISKLDKQGKSCKNKIIQALFYTLITATCFALAFIFLPSVAVKILYPSLNEEFTKITVNLLKLSSISVVFLPLMQTSASVLIAKGKFYAPVITSSVGVTVKLITSYFLLKTPKINIFGAVISDILCYFVATFLNLIYTINILFIKRSKQCTKLPQSV